MNPETRARQLAGEFALAGTLTEVRPHGSGLINDTFLVTTDRGPQAILQRLNTQVFPHPEKILENLRTVLALWQTLPDEALRLPALIPTHAGQDHVVDDDGGFWRMQEFIPATRSLQTLANADQARAVGAALGRFHAVLAELPVETLHTTLPGFHVTPDYLQRFDEALESSRVDLSTAMRQALGFVEERRAICPVLETAKAAGELVLRPTHGDPKLDNFLFDTDARNVVAVIDLDTVQPGLIQIDVADCLRSACNRLGEFATDPHAVRFDLALARAVLNGYLAEARELFTAEDAGYLYEAIRLIPFELGLRFLTDHFAGDRYFRVTRPGDNLARALAQFRLTEDIERHEATLRQLIASLT